VIRKLRQSYKIDVTHQAGIGKACPVQSEYNNESANAFGVSKVVEFIENIPNEFANADIVICRSGALTVAEVAATGSCAIFVPLPIAVDDHQTYNAKSLSEHGAAVLIQQTNLDSDLYLQLNQFLSQSEKITEMASKAKALCIQDATLKVSAAIVQEGLRITL
jgi:UDP-N-acetylglucosamine--N-acetylmuramyl-(pentapeptide) pyrophosphoryl-undecaprenol N-acetylglucosamine transferase